MSWHSSSTPNTEEKGSSFRNWMMKRIQDVLCRNESERPFLVWCDPEGEWLELLRTISSSADFELWADPNEHELILRDRFYGSQAAPRLIWLPVARDNIGYFKAFELQAAAVFDITLAEGLAEYGVKIAPGQLAEVKPLLPAHAKEWLEYPLTHWKEHLSQGQVKSSLVDDDLFLEALASKGISLEKLVGSERVAILNRRAVEDFGLPPIYEPLNAVLPPEEIDIDVWRIQATAAMLVTEAVSACPESPPRDDKTIDAGAQRDKALKLLSQWKKRIDLLDSFETLAPKADATTTLQFWARNLDNIPAPLSSPIVERTLLESEVERLAKLDSFDSLAAHFDERLTSYQAHGNGFWGKTARDKVPWTHLVHLASTGSLLNQHADIEKTWQEPRQAVDWYVGSGWQVDHAGEELLAQAPGTSGALVGVRARLRRAYLRHLDEISSVFSGLLASKGLATLGLTFAGDLIKEVAEKASVKAPVAILVLDAFRYDLGCRLTNMLNEGEPKRRASVAPTRSTLPSVTAVGMPFCLPGAPETLKVKVGEKDIQVFSIDFDGDLSVAGQRRAWLKKRFRLKDESFLSVAQVVNPDGEDGVTSKQCGKLVFVFGDEFDDEGHEGRLKLTGSESHLERYARAIRTLRSGGYSTIAVVTDHGFFHWDPAEDEVEAKPAGDLMWISRRAAIGHGLNHESAVILPATGAQLECAVPRSVNAFKTYGGLGFFHGGASLQELVTPVITAIWPKKASKIGVVIKPLSAIVSLSQRVDIAPEAVQPDMFHGLDETLVARPVKLKVIHPDKGNILFRSTGEAVIQPGGEVQTLQLEKLDGAEATAGCELELLAIDADDEEIVDRRQVTLKLGLDEWF